MKKSKNSTKICASIVAILLLLGLTACFAGSAIIKPDTDDFYFEFGKKMNLPDTTVFNNQGEPIAYDAVCVSMIAPDGSEVDVSTGFVTPMQVGTYILTYESASQKAKAEIAVECKDTIAPTLSMTVPEAYLIKEKYEDTEHTVFTLPVISADDLAGIDVDRTSVSITVDGTEISMDGDKFTIPVEGKVVFSVTVYDLNGLSTTITRESFATEPEFFEEYCLSTFAKESYLANVCGGWLRSWYSASILESDTDPSGKTMEGVLKITYDATDKEAGACIHLARPIKGEDVQSIEVTFRVEDGTIASGNIDACIYKSNYYNGFWTTPNVSILNGGNYRTYSIPKSVLNSMVGEDGYIRQIQIETFGDGNVARSLYIADISYTPVGAEPSVPDEPNVPDVPDLPDVSQLPENCLSAFDSEAYKNLVCGGWLYSKYEASILQSDTDTSGATYEGVLKITYPAADKEAGTCIHFAKPIKRSDIKTLHITLRLENVPNVPGTANNILFYQADYYNGYWTTNHGSATVGTNYVTINISGLLDKLTDSDGYIRKIQMETFGDGNVARSLYIADISYTPSGN